LKQTISIAYYGSGMRLPFVVIPWLIQELINDNIINEKDKTNDESYKELSDK